METFAVTMVTLLFGGMVVALLVRTAWTINASKYDRFGIACGRCGAEGVEERAGGAYRCGACGFDSEAPRSEAEEKALQRIQELGIAVECLNAAVHELNMSRRVQSTSSSGESRSSGPHPEKYLEGLEQANEARRIAMGLGLADLTHALTTLPTLDEGEHNTLVAVAVPQVEGVRGELQTELRRARSA